ncbi:MULTISPECIES: DUF6875 domain-containing protein [unclassified Anabaena]|uniref:DUF6875 domain-containing protein n=1 Tax=unclassified Anabaena TaxID=2619674 RepID=UPI0039C68C07
MAQLYTPHDIEKLQADIPYLVETWNWLRNFLAQSHPDLGRMGTVCPYMPKALNLNYIRLKVIRSPNIDIQEVSEIVLTYLNAFLELEPTEKDEAIYKTIVLIFPDITHEDAPRIIDVVQKQLKPLFVESGLMLGEFHNYNETPGLHNSDFRPLRSPIPMLAIRFMVESDLPFLQNVEDPLYRIKYLQAYLKRFHQNFKDKNRIQTASQALELAQQQITGDNVLMPKINKCPFHNLY